MRNFLRLGSIAIAVTFIFGIFAVIDTNAQGLNEVLKLMDAHQKTIQTLQADVTMEKYNSQIDEKDVTVGSMKYLPKTKDRVRYIRISWARPIVEEISVIGNDYTLYRPRVPQVIIGKTEQAKNNAKVGGALSFMSLSKEEIRANYSLKYLGKETVQGATLTSRIELTPKQASNFKTVYIWIDKDGMPIMTQVVERNNDSTTVLLSNLKKNDTLNGDDFAVKYPKSLKPVKG